MAAWRKWSIILVSASYCWHGNMAVMSVALLLSTMSAFVERRSYIDSTVLLWSSWPMNWNSSSLFWLSLRNFCHSTPLGIGILERLVFDDLKSHPAWHESVTWDSPLGMCPRLRPLLMCFQSCDSACMATIASACTPQIFWRAGVWWCVWLRPYQE